MNKNIKNRLNSLFNYSNDAIIICEKSGRITEMNEHALEKFGSKILGKSIKSVNRALFDSFSYISTNYLVQSVCRKLKLKTGESRTHQCTIVPVYNGEKVGEIIILARDVEDIEFMKDEVQRLKDKIKELERENNLLSRSRSSTSSTGLNAEALKKLERANEKLETINKNFTKELELASILQKSLIPSQTPTRDTLNFAIHFEPMGLVGGDYCDIIEFKGGKKGVFIADVSGHGVSSAFIAAMLKISFLNYSVHSTSPAEVLLKLNSEYCRVIKTADYVTAFYTIFDPQNRSMIYSGAGHPMPMLYHRESGKFELLPSEGFFVGMFENATYKDASADFMPGDRYLLYTDGIIEAYSEEKEEQFGDKRLKESFKRYKDEPLQEMLAAIIKDVKSFMNKSRFYDDLTMVAIEYSLQGKK